VSVWCPCLRRCPFSDKWSSAEGEGNDYHQMVLCSSLPFLYFMHITDFCFNKALTIHQLIQFRTPALPCYADRHSLDCPLSWNYNVSA
uniref:Uncharacterized protein n=1 Tax=Anabas testudineus TaxID=64144 RepID=A0A7N6FHJ3_ANATE